MALYSIISIIIDYLTSLYISNYSNRLKTIKNHLKKKLKFIK